MIDTMRFRVELTQKQYDCIRRKSTELAKRDNTNDRMIFRVLREDLPLGSYDRCVNLFVNDDLECFIELSIPKFVMGHNIYLISAESVPGHLETLYKKLCKYFGDFPAVVFWEVMRVDLCYAWKLRNHSVAVRVMEALQKLEVARKKKATYATSVMFHAPTMSIKFYLKDDEFYAHDLKELKQIGLTDFAYQMYQISEGVLRFEITIRKKHLNTIFADGQFYSDKTCQRILRKYLHDVLRGQSEATTLDVVAERLLATYKKQKAYHLYSFYRLYYGEPQGRAKLLRYISRQQVWRHLKDLEKAKVGLVVDVLASDFDLSCPSDFVVNPISPVPDRGRAVGK